MKSTGLLLISFSILLAGCSTTRLGTAAKTLKEAGASIYAPPHYMTEARLDELKPLRKELGATPLTGSGQSFVYSAIFDINKDYGKYLDILSSGRANLNVAYDSLNLGLTGAATAFTPASTKTVLAGLSTFFQGQKSSIDKNLFDDKAIFALTAIMEVRRSAALTIITKKISAPGYNLGEALIDLESLYRAGTLQIALQAAFLNQQPPSAPGTPTTTAAPPAQPSNTTTPNTSTIDRTANPLPPINTPVR